MSCLRRVWILFAFLVLAAASVLQAAPPGGFGRFGRDHNDGLLTLNVTPDRIAFPSPVNGLTIRFADAAVQATVASLDSTEKILDLAASGAGGATRLRATLLYPGVELQFGTTANFRFSHDRINIERFEIPGSQAPIVAYFLRPSSGNEVPIVIACRQGLSPTHQWVDEGSTGRLVLTLASGDLGAVRVATPIGMRRVASTIAGAELAALRNQAIWWAGTSVPRLTDRTILLDREGNQVTTVELFDRATDDGGRIIAPVPPVLAFAAANGYPVDFAAPILRQGALTKYGDFAHCVGSTLTYTLPIPPTEERGYLIPESAPAPRMQLLSALVGHLNDTWESNAVDFGYAGKACAQMAAPLLDTTRRTNLANDWTALLPLAFRMPPYPDGDTKTAWKEETEPFSNAPYIWTYKLDGPAGEKLDIEWGNMLPLYGLQKYAQWSGDWARVRTYWPQVLRIYAYMEAATDWAWMTVCNGDMGWGTGTGDPMTAAYAGHIACVRMARALGDEEREKIFAWHAARAAVPTVARLWYFRWARQQGFIGASSVVQGFWERSHFTATSLNPNATDPWGPTNLLSGNGPLHETYAAMIAYARTGLEDFLTEYATAYNPWFDGTRVYPFETTYGGNSVYVVFPHIMARAMLGEPTATLWQYVDGCAENRRTTAWVGPPVIAEILARETPFHLIAWEPAAYTDGRVDSGGRSVTLQFNMREQGVWHMEARWRSESLLPSTVTVAGQPVPFTFAGGILRTEPSTRTGAFTAKVTMTPTPNGLAAR